MVIGANGLLGTNLSNHLLQSGNNLIAVDAFRDSSRITPDENLKLIKADINQKLDLGSIFPQVDNVVYLISGLTPSLKLTNIELKKREEGSRRTLDFFWQTNISRFLFASTGGAMFAKSRSDFHNETEEPTPNSQYAEEKLKFESILAEYAFSSSVSAITFRGSNFYGSPVIYRNAHGLIPALLQSAKTGEVFSQFGSSETTRDFLYAKDAALMIQALIQGNPKHNLYNLCSGEGHSISTIIEIVEKVTNRPITVQKLEAPGHFVKKSILNPSRFNSEFGVMQLTPLSKGIEQMWKTITY